MSSCPKNIGHPNIRERTNGTRQRTQTPEYGTKDTDQMHISVMNTVTTGGTTQI